ncbi:hypothetical protein P0136_10395 [Lentisphaerota bacterium ZTH]|nr:hypothetical protein JYG24_12095 [Lentisphaerota bacterium]WET05770.1 hypothetical protein P0136_10395 [Lentisphaerota bacterium ZTH]
MVKLIKYLVIIAALCVAGVFIWKHFFGKSEVEIIKEQIYSLASEASKKAGESIPSAIIHAKTVENFFTDPCYINVGTQMFSGKYSQIQIGASCMRYRQMFKQIKFTAHDLEVNLTGTGTATAFLTAELRGITRSGRNINAFRELECSFVFHKDKWLISKVNIRRIIEK